MLTAWLQSQRNKKQEALVKKIATKKKFMAAVEEQDATAVATILSEGAIYIDEALVVKTFHAAVDKCDVNMVAAILKATQLKEGPIFDAYERAYNRSFVFQNPPKTPAHKQLIASLLYTAMYQAQDKPQLDHISAQALEKIENSFTAFVMEEDWIAIAATLIRDNIPISALVKAHTAILKKPESKKQKDEPNILPNLSRTPVEKQEIALLFYTIMSNAQKKPEQLSISPEDLEKIENNFMVMVQKGDLITIASTLISNNIPTSVITKAYGEILKKPKPPEQKVEKLEEVGGTKKHAELASLLLEVLLHRQFTRKKAGSANSIEFWYLCGLHPKIQNLTERDVSFQHMKTHGLLESGPTGRPQSRSPSPVKGLTPSSSSYSLVHMATGKPFEYKGMPITPPYKEKSSPTMSLTPPTSQASSAVAEQKKFNEKKLESPVFLDTENFFKNMQTDEQRTAAPLCISIPSPSPTNKPYPLGSPTGS